MECLEALDEEERRIVETLGEILGKALRLTEVLSEEEKQQIKKYNEVARFFGSDLLMNGAKKEWWKGYTEQELAELRFQYDQIMAKYGEKTYE